MVADIHALSDVSAYALWNGPVSRNLALVQDWSQLKVLEVGAGDGRLGNALQRLGAEVVQLDRDLDTYRRYGRPPERTRFVTGDTENLPFPAEAFDVVVSCSTLQYVDHQRAISEMTRVLRGNGLMLLHENGRYNPGILLGRFVRRAQSRKSPQLAAYVRTIKGYFSLSRIPANAELHLLAKSNHYVLGPVHEYFARRLPATSRLRAEIREMDDWLVAKIRILQGLAWFNCYVLAKKSRTSLSDSVAAERLRESGAS